jgi:molybdenum cofactor cytidylyltransferase
VNVAGLILAAGESRRMGSPKALLPFRGETFLDRLIGLFAQYCSPIVTVLGHEPEAIRRGLLHPERARFVVNADYRQGQITSMQCGLRAIPAEAEGVLFTLVDHPNVQAETLDRLLEAPRPLLAIPRYAGRRGHPLFFARELIPEFLALPADSSARDVLQKHSEGIRYVDVQDPGILDDIDDPETYRRLAGEPA